MKITLLLLMFFYIALYARISPFKTFLALRVLVYLFIILGSLKDKFNAKKGEEKWKWI